MKLAAHGRYRITVNDRTVILIPAGPHNLESFQAFIRDFNRLTGDLDRTGRWGLCVIAVGNLVMSPIAERLMRGYVRKVGKRGGIECVVQFHENLNEAKILTKIQWSKVYEGAKPIPWAIFESEEEARGWLKSFGYPLSISDEDRAFIDANRKNRI